MKQFEDYVDKREPDECWPWLGAKSQGERAMYWDKTTKKVITAARMAWSLVNNKSFPTNLHACHSCDNGMCVNPKHIWPGTRSQNMIDCAQKGRHRQSHKNHCANGHEYSVENTYLSQRGHRRCKICQAANSARWLKNLRTARPETAEAQA